MNDDVYQFLHSVDTMVSITLTSLLCQDIFIKFNFYFSNNVVKYIEIVGLT